MGACLSVRGFDKESEVDLEDIIRESDTGDLIIFAGIGNDSNIVRMCSNTPVWSHVGVVVRLDGVNMLLDSSRDRTLNSHGIRQKNGVKLRDLGKVLRKYNGNVFGWRKLITTKRADTSLFYEGYLETLTKDMSRYEYTRDLLELYKSINHSNTDLGIDYFCTKMAIDFYIKMGVISNVRLPNNYNMDDLSGDYGSRLPYMMGFYLSDIFHAFKF
jgi:hypothetical protein